MSRPFVLGSSFEVSGCTAGGVHVLDHPSGGALVKRKTLRPGRTRCGADVFDYSLEARIDEVVGPPIHSGRVDVRAEDLEQATWLDPDLTSRSRGVVAPNDRVAHVDPTHQSMLIATACWADEERRWRNREHVVD